MTGFELVEELDVIKPGRPVNKRGAELEEMMLEAQKAGVFGIKVELADDEKGKFYRFSQRARLAAKRLGLKVNVSVVHEEEENAGYIRLLEDEEK